MAQMNETPSGERTHIAFFGKRNAGKSSLMNAFTGQQIAIVSDYKGTTTDPVQKAMELLPLGPVLVIDTPGLDDIGELGAKRIEAAERILRKTDIALLIADNTGTDEELRELRDLASVRGIPYIIVHNKSDLLEKVPEETEHPVVNYKNLRIKVLKVEENAIAKVLIHINPVTKPEEDGSEENSGSDE